MNIEKLRAKISEMEAEQEKAKSVFYRLEGAITVLKEQLLEAENVKVASQEVKVEKKKG